MVAGPLRKAAHAVAGDWCAFVRQMRVTVGSGRTKPGLYQWRFRGDSQEQVRLHLRVEADGTGLLLVNVWEAVHLSALATEMARMLLDGVSVSQVARLLHIWYPQVPAGQLQADLGRVAELIQRARTPQAGCPTCGLQLERRPVFSARARAPYKADLALTYACNNACAHCYNEPGRKSMASLSLPEWQRVLRKLATIGVPHLIFTGGEPTLVPFLPALVASAECLGLATGLNTNGRQLARDGLARRLARAGLDHVQVTLESPEAAVHDAMVGASAHAETLQGIQAALDAGLHTITNTTLTSATQSEAVAMVDFLHGLGLTTFAMNGMICAGGGCHNSASLTEASLVPLLDRVRSRAEELGMRFLWYTPTQYCKLSPLDLELGPKACNAAEYSVCVEPNGDVLPCQSYYEPAGNLLTDEWPAIWESPLFSRIRNRREHPREAGLPQRCWTCPDLQVCGGGCLLEQVSKEASQTPKLSFAAAGSTRSDDPQAQGGI